MIASAVVTNGGSARRWDAVVVGASLAGCSTAMQLGRAGARVALVESRPDPDAFKRICGHYVQAGAVPALERLGLLDEIVAAGGVRSGLRLWSPWGWITARDEVATPPGVNLRREVLDPLVRGRAAETAGVELMLGRRAERLIVEDGRFAGVEVHTPDGAVERIRAKLVVGADGRASKVADLAGVTAREAPHGRFSYGVYVESGDADADTDARLWMTDPDWAATFPTDAGLTLYSCMPTKDKLPEFKRDLLGALLSFLRALPHPPPVDGVRIAGSVIGKVEMPNVKRAPVAPGLALVGDAALATDPLWGVGCGWAFEGGVRLADAVAPALLGGEPLERALGRYRRRHRRALAVHSWLIDDYATGRRFNLAERAAYSAAAHDRRVMERFYAAGSRSMQPTGLLPVFPRIAAVNVRRGLAGLSRSA